LSDFDWHLDGFCVVLGDGLGRDRYCNRLRLGYNVVGEVGVGGCGYEARTGSKEVPRLSLGRH
jgi:hypothetical protein